MSWNPEWAQAHHMHVILDGIVRFPKWDSNKYHKALQLVDVPGRRRPDPKYSGNRRNTYMVRKLVPQKDKRIAPS